MLVTLKQIAEQAGHQAEGAAGVNILLCL